MITKAVFFDVDFTLIHPGPTFQGHGYSEACARHGVTADASRFDAAVAAVSPGAADYYIFPAKFGAFGLLMAVFLIFEPLGLVGIWRRVRNWFFLWPFRHRPLRAA